MPGHATLASKVARRQARQFGVAVALAAVISIAFIVWMSLVLGGVRATGALDDITEAIAAMVAGIACFVAGRRGPEQNAGGVALHRRWRAGLGTRSGGVDLARPRGWRPAPRAVRCRCRVLGSGGPSRFIGLFRFPSPIRDRFGRLRAVVEGLIVRARC